MPSKLVWLDVGALTAGLLSRPSTASGSSENLNELLDGPMGVWGVTGDECVLALCGLNGCFHFAVLLLLLNELWSLLLLLPNL